MYSDPWRAVSQSGLFALRKMKIKGKFKGADDGDADAYKTTVAACFL